MALTIAQICEPPSVTTTIGRRFGFDRAMVRDLRKDLFFAREC